MKTPLFVFFFLVVLMLDVSGAWGASFVVSAPTFSITPNAAVTTSCDYPLIRIGTNTYGTIQQAIEAIDNAIDGGVIDVNVYDYVEDIQFDNNGPVTLQGGYDCDLSTVVDYTEIDGSVTIQGSGPVTIDSIIINHAPTVGGYLDRNNRSPILYASFRVTDFITTSSLLVRERGVEPLRLPTGS